MRVGITLILSLALVAAVASCARFTYCGRLEAVARDHDAQTYLRAWVAKNVPGAFIGPNDWMMGEGVVPGFRWLGKTFDAKVLGFGDRAHVRLIGPGPGNVLDDDLAPLVKAILFTERSRTGVLVRLPEASDFGLEGGAELRAVADDVAAYCDIDSPRRN